MSTVPRLTSRAPGFVELVIRNSADVAAYRISAANSLDVAFTAPTAMLTIQRGATYKSPALRKKRIGTSIYTNRGLTIAQYDPEDFWVGGGTLPHDGSISYLVVEEQNAAGVFRPAGPILIVPSHGFFATTRPALTVAGTAPNVASTTTGEPPDGALRFVLPKFADAATITNNGSASLFISFSAGSPELEILHSTSTFLPDAAMSEIYIRGEGADVPFSIFFAIVNAEMA